MCILPLSKRNNTLVSVSDRLHRLADLQPEDAHPCPQTPRSLAPPGGRRRPGGDGSGESQTGRGKWAARRARRSHGVSQASSGTEGPSRARRSGRADEPPAHGEAGTPAKAARRGWGSPASWGKCVPRRGGRRVQPRGRLTRPEWSWGDGDRTRKRGGRSHRSLRVTPGHPGKRQQRVHAPADAEVMTHRRGCYRGRQAQGLQSAGWSPSGLAA